MSATAMSAMSATPPNTEPMMMPMFLELGPEDEEGDVTVLGGWGGVDDAAGHAERTTSVRQAAQKARIGIHGQPRQVAQSACRLSGCTVYNFDIMAS